MLNLVRVNLFRMLFEERFSIIVERLVRPRGVPPLEIQQFLAPIALQQRQELIFGAFNGQQFKLVLAKWKMMKSSAPSASRDRQSIIEGALSFFKMLQREAVHWGSAPFKAFLLAPLLSISFPAIPPQGPATLSCATVTLTSTLSLPLTTAPRRDNFERRDGTNKWDWLRCRFLSILSFVPA